MPEPTLCCSALGGYCDRCDLLVGLDGLRVIAVERDEGGGLTVSVETEPGLMGCPTCGCSLMATAGCSCVWSMPRGRAGR